jgi:hypothetical protein
MYASILCTLCKEHVINNNFSKELIRILSLHYLSAVINVNHLAEKLLRGTHTQTNNGNLNMALHRIAEFYTVVRRLSQHNLEISHKRHIQKLHQTKQ